MQKQEWTEHKLHHIYGEVAFGRGHHGSFLKAFSDCYIRADNENKALLAQAAVELADKYHLDEYLDNFTCEQCGGRCEGILRGLQESLHK